MNYFRRTRILRLAVFLLYAALLSGIIYSPLPVILGQTGASGKWDPTRVPGGTNFVGDRTCAECHMSQAASHGRSSMAMAMESVAESRILIAHPKLSFRIGSYSYGITRQNSQSLYTVTDGGETVSAQILFAFGQGKAGQTYVLQYDGAFFESRVSFYNDIRGLDLTLGAPRSAPASLREAVGRRLSKDDALKCFSCHSTGSVSGAQLHLDKLIPGVRCEACHGPGGEHVTASKAGQAGGKLIFNPGRLGGDELTQEFCAACHRGSEEFSLLSSMGINNVRFQPYRIFNSKCYSDDRRISCTACHNPHAPVREDASYYDAKCMMCHKSGEKTLKARPQDKPFVRGCRIGKNNCVSCHMPKVEPPGAHFKFTDHRIRITRPNEVYPN